MKKHTLLIHHLEETWREGLERFDQTPEKMASQIIDFLHSPRGAIVNDVILTRWESPGYEDIPDVLINYLDKCNIPHRVEVFPYGLEREQFIDNENATLIIANRYGGDEDQVIEVEEWHKDLSKNASVHLCGAFEGECIQDARDVLDHVRNGRYIALDGLIAGTHQEYDNHYESAENKIVELNGTLRELDEIYEDDPTLAVDMLDTKLELLRKDQGMLLALAFFQNDENGYVVSEHKDLNDAVDHFIETISLTRPDRSPKLEVSNSPSF